MTRLLQWLPLSVGLAACSGGAARTSDGGGGSGGDATVPDTGLVTTFARVDDQGTILGVGAIIPVKSVESVPNDDPAFQGNVGLEMPASVRDKTFIQLLRINWLSGGHGPAPYGAPHFDMHFYRGTMDEVSAISCADATFPADILASGIETPSTCVSGMGYHAWPSADLVSGVFTASIILGYAAEKMVFIEPMVTREVLLSRKTFELDIARPASAGGARTLYPAHLTATYDATTDAYSLEFNAFGSID